MLPGLAAPFIDAHTHLMPARLFAAVRRYFKANLWHPWAEYEGDTEELVPKLLASGVDRFVFTPYAHRGDMAESLNHWAANVQQTYPESAIAFGTMHPDDGDAVGRLVDDALGPLALQGFKLHPQVGRFDADDPRLWPLYQRVIEENRPVLIHAGPRPEPSAHVGVGAFARLMRRFPDLTVIVAHLGGDEFDAFFDLCGQYERVYLDTCMVFNGFLGGPPPVERVIEFQDRVLYGSDFPLIPYRLETSVQAVRDLHLGATIEAKLFSTNAARVLGLEPPGPDAVSRSPGASGTPGGDKGARGASASPAPRPQP